MKRKYEIPQMSDKDIAHWYENIRPIVKRDTYLRKLSERELTHVAYTWLTEAIDYAEKVVAFEIIAGAIGMEGIFKDELNAGFHVSIVRLYQAKDDTNEAAQQIERYPTPNYQVPVGMAEEQFKKLFIFK
jgi:hypothetical protein